MSLNIILGFPGSGKSTLAARIVRRNHRKNVDTYCNFDVQGALLYSVSDLGVFSITDGELIMDEAGIELNSRNWKGMSKEAISFFKLYRHYGIRNIYVFSQGYDFDVTLRRLADHMFIISKKGPFSMLRELRPHWDTENMDDSGMPRISWNFRPLGFKFLYRRRYYKYFDSFEAPALPFKEFPVCGQAEEGSAPINSAGCPPEATGEPRQNPRGPSNNEQNNTSEEEDWEKWLTNMVALKTGQQ